MALGAACMSIGNVVEDALRVRHDHEATRGLGLIEQRYETLHTFLLYTCERVSDRQSNVQE